MSSMQLIADDIRVLVDPEHGGRVASLKFARHEMLVTTAINPLTWGIYPMVPYAGRVRDARLTHAGITHALRMNSEPHSLHGTVFDRQWAVTHASESALTMEVDLGPHWPFAGRVSHTVMVAARELNCTLTVTAHQPMPAQVGWHPWFRRPVEVNVDFGGMLLRDHEGIATDEIVEVPTGPVDDCFIDARSNPRVRVKNVTLEIASDCSHWVVYYAPSGDVCIEPQSGPPNGVNARPLIVEPGSPLTRTMTIRRVD